MTVFVRIFKWGLNLIFAFMKLSTVRNKVTFLSRQSDEKPLDIQLLEAELLRQDENLEVTCLCKTMMPGIAGAIKYSKHLLRQMWHISVSSVVLIDGYCMGVSLLKQRSCITVIQMWHALGSLKKFGYSIVDKEEGRDRKLTEAMNMHKNYDVIFTSSSACAKNFADAFGYSEEKVRVQPLPRVDVLKNKEHIEAMKEEILKVYPQLAEKKNIVYAPTFRKESKDNENAIRELIKAVDQDKYNFIVKGHPLMKMENEQEGILLDEKFSSIDMFAIADYIVVDYSAIIYEAALMKKPMFFYVPDLYRYKDNRDFYINYEREMPGIISDHAEEILQAIECDDYDLDRVDEFAGKYVEIQNDCTRKMAAYIRSLM